MNTTAVILAAGLSTRMGSPKMLLPWRGTTVLGQVIRAVHEAGVGDVLVVVGADHEAIESASHAEGARCVLNRQYEGGEMLSSLQVGLAHLESDRDAALVVLGDQPRIEPPVVRSILAVAVDARTALVAPSHARRRGHPWLLGRAWWEEVGRLRAPQTLQDFLKQNAASIVHVEVSTDSILRDVDTPQDYAESRP